VTRFRLRHGDQQIGPWWPTSEQAEEAAIALKLAHHDTHYDVLVLAPDVEIDGEDDGTPDLGDSPPQP
jgi:hypothetical protein